MCSYTDVLMLPPNPSAARVLLTKLIASSYNTHMYHSILPELKYQQHTTFLKSAELANTANLELIIDVQSQ